MQSECLQQWCCSRQWSGYPCRVFSALLTRPEVHAHSPALRLGSSCASVQFHSDIQASVLLWGTCATFLLQRSLDWPALFANRRWCCQSFTSYKMRCLTSALSSSIATNRTKTWWVGDALAMWCKRGSLGEHAACFMVLASDHVRLETMFARLGLWPVIAG